jgi:hypothetical protein
VEKASGLYPLVGVDAAGSQVVSQAGGVLLTKVIRVSGVDRKLSAAVARWRKPLACKIRPRDHGSGGDVGAWAATAWPISLQESAAEAGRRTWSLAAASSPDRG